MKRFLVVTVLAGAMCFATAGAQAALLTNGSFELGAPLSDPGSHMTLPAGDANLTGWSIYSGSVDCIGTYWNAAEGTAAST